MVGDHSPDFSNHFIDVVIDEIPYIACKKNPHGKNVIDRIPVSNRSGGVVEYQAPISEYFSQNYFYPISLSKLSIKIYEDSDHLYQTANHDNYFEFELTKLRNTKNIDQPLS